MSEFLIHEITPGVTTTPPPGVDVPVQDSASIALIIVWTLVVFVLLLLAISLFKSRCCGKDGIGNTDPFTYRAPSESMFGRLKDRGAGKKGFGRLNGIELPSSTHSNVSDTVAQVSSTSNPIYTYGSKEDDRFSY